MKPPAFISYARADAEFALRLAADLKAKGADVWLDQLDIKPGGKWAREIEHALAACNEMMVILSPLAVDSDNLMNEVTFALDEGKRVIPIIHRDCKLPLLLRARQYVDVRTDYDRGLVALLATLGVEQGASAAAAALEERPIATARTEPRVQSPPAERIGDSDSFQPKSERMRTPRHAKRRPRLVTTGIVVLCLSGAVSGIMHLLNSSKAHGPPKRAKIASGVPVLHEGDTKVNPKDGLTYVWIAPGTFTMGCSPGDNECGGDEKPAHPVTISKGFWIGQTEVTQQAYVRVIGNNPSDERRDRLPVEQVSWYDSISYCHAVDMRLPTEAEWEYAARAGDTTVRYGQLDAVAWYEGNSGDKPHEVAQKQPNAFGLYDMLGNVSEWVNDWWDYKYYSLAAITDPQGPSTGKYRVWRGGSFLEHADRARASMRDDMNPNFRRVIYDIGFRCAGD